MSVFATSPRAVGRRLGMSWLSEFWHRTGCRLADAAFATDTAGKILASGDRLGERDEKTGQ